MPGVLVYVPNSPVKAFTKGVQCSQCGADVTGDPLSVRGPKVGEDGRPISVTFIDGTAVPDGDPLALPYPWVARIDEPLAEVEPATFPQQPTTEPAPTILPRWEF